VVAPPKTKGLNRETVLGIDPGSIVTGWGLIEIEGNRLCHVAHGTIGVSTALGQAARLSQIYRGIHDIVRQYQPAAVSLEKVFFSRNVQSALKLGQARGMALLAAAQNHIDVSEYSAAEIKVAVVGYGRATKEQVQRMVTALLCLRGAMRADAADALAAAICHVHRATFQARVPQPLSGRVRGTSWRDYVEIGSKR
jgi:crossover junction endodeoxyribonuclease RuvC